ncbi:hypothetical protein AACH10_25305 [Ideonella sp. DXS22W]|uniref:Uncharacterized protein n=1 Tax=Pseudaquabacterium inlustre TaxID=2984192 RepID=A0ABU9CSR4_9BURK
MHVGNSVLCGDDLGRRCYRLLQLVDRLHVIVFQAYKVLTSAPPAVDDRRDLADLIHHQPQEARDLVVLELMVRFRATLIKVRVPG